MKRNGWPEAIITDEFRFYGIVKKIGNTVIQEMVCCFSNYVENYHMLLKILPCHAQFLEDPKFQKFVTVY